MHPAGEKRGGRPNDKYTAEALKSIKQDLTRFEVQNNHRNNQVSSRSLPPPSSLNISGYRTNS